MLSKVKTWIFRAICYLSPIKVVGIFLIIISLVSDITHPLYHQRFDILHNEIIEFIMKSWFMFSAFYSLLGNGDTINSRLIAVLLPLYYLTSLYLINLIITNVHALIIPTILLLIISAWLTLAGEYYEFTSGKCNSFIISYIDWVSSKSNNKVT